MPPSQVGIDAVSWEFPLKYHLGQVDCDVTELEKTRTCRWPSRSFTWRGWRSTSRTFPGCRSLWFLSRRWWLWGVCGWCFPLSRTGSFLRRLRHVSKFWPFKPCRCANSWKKAKGDNQKDTVQPLCPNKEIKQIVIALALPRLANIGLDAQRFVSRATFVALVQMPDVPVVTGYYRYTDIWFEWYASYLPILESGPDHKQASSATWYRGPSACEGDPGYYLHLFCLYTTLKNFLLKLMMHSFILTTHSMSKASKVLGCTLVSHPEVILIPRLLIFRLRNISDGRSAPALLIRTSRLPPVLAPCNEVD